MTHRFTQQREDYPAPNAYDPVTTKKNTGFTLKSRHVPVIKNENPGPGAYNPSFKFEDETRANITFHDRIADKIEESPAPNEYSPVEQKSGKLIRIAPRYSNPREDDVPAPNQYSPLQPVNKYTITFASRSKSAKIERLPGPGQYQSRNLFAANDAPKLTFHQRFSRKICKDSPAPNAYEVRNPRSQRSISFGQKYALPEDSDRPPPNAYNPKIIRRQAPCYTLKGRDIDIFKVKNENPAPCEFYYKRKYRGQGAQLAGRDYYCEKNDTPAPNKYEIKSPENSHKLTIHSRFRETKKPASPGPSTYSLHEEEAKKISLSSRYTEASDLVKDKTPGPGAYEVPEKPQGVSTYIGQRHDEKRDMDVPGPGTYEYRDDFERKTNTAAGRGLNKDSVAE